MTAWLVEDRERRTINVALPNAHGMPCYLRDADARPIEIDPRRAMSRGDLERHLQRQLEHFAHVHQVFQGMLRRYG